MGFLAVSVCISQLLVSLLMQIEGVDQLLHSSKTDSNGCAITFIRW